MPARFYWCVTVVTGRTLAYKIRDISDISVAITEDVKRVPCHYCGHWGSPIRELASRALRSEPSISL